MKKTLLMLFVIPVSIGYAQEIHDKRFFKKKTYRNIDLEQFLAKQDFTEIIIYDSSKVNLLTKPINGAFYNIKTKTRLFMNNNHECFYDVEYQYLDLNPYPLEIVYEKSDDQFSTPIQRFIETQYIEVTNPLAI